MSSSPTPDGSAAPRQNIDAEIRTSSWPPSEDDGISLLRVASVALRQRALVAGTVVATVALVVIAVMLSTRVYTSSTSFVTQGTKEGAGGLSSFAAQLGVAIPQGDPTQSPAFYTHLIKSRPILVEAVTAHYVVRSDGRERRLSLPDLYEVRGRNANERIEATVSRLRANSDASIAREIGLVTFSVTTPWPAVSAQIVQNVIQAINRFNLQTRQTSVGAERRFVERRLAEVENELRTAENRLQQFNRTNREFGPGSELSLERKRLEQQVSMRQQVYVALAQAYEQAKIDEVRDTPSITVVEPAQVPIAADSRRTIRKALLAAIVGLLIGFVLAFLREWVNKERLSPSPEFRQVSAQAQEAARSLRHPFRTRA